VVYFAALAHAENAYRVYAANFFGLILRLTSDYATDAKAIDVRIIFHSEKQFLQTSTEVK